MPDRMTSLPQPFQGVSAKADRAATASRLSPCGSSAKLASTNAEDLWTEDLTEPQLAMVIESGNEGFFPGGHGVELIGAGAWRVARSLVAKGLGTIEGGAPQGSSLPGLYFNNAEGARIVGEFDEEDEE